MSRGIDLAWPCGALAIVYSACGFLLLVIYGGAGVQVCRWVGYQVEYPILFPAGDSRSTQRASGRLDARAMSRGNSLAMACADRSECGCAGNPGGECGLLPLVFDVVNGNKAAREVTGISKVILDLKKKKKNRFDVPVQSETANFIVELQTPNPNFKRYNLLYDKYAYERQGVPP